MAFNSVGILALPFAYSSSTTESRTACNLNRGESIYRGMLAEIQKVNKSSYLPGGSRGGEYEELLTPTLLDLSQSESWTKAGSDVCCNNFVKDEKGDCSICVLGYYGEFCETPCPSGSFGHGCGGDCSPKCDPEDCDHVKGCPTTTTSNTPVTAPGSTVFTTVQRHRILNISTSPSSVTLVTSSTNISKRFTALPSTQPSIITDSNPENSQFNTNYLIVGVGAIIAVLLLVMVIQKCLKSKSTQRNISKRKSRDSNVPVDSVTSRDTDKKKYGELYHYGNKNHFYQHMESDYQEIDSCSEMASLNSGEKALCSTDQSSMSPEPNDSFLAPIAESDEYLEPVTQEAYIEPHHLQPYLNPPGKPMERKHSSNERFHSYIEVVELGEMESTEDKSYENTDNTHRRSSSYDDVMLERPSVHLEIDEEDNTYLDAVFS